MVRSNVFESCKGLVERHICRLVEWSIVVVRNPILKHLKHSCVFLVVMFQKIPKVYLIRIIIRKKQISVWISSSDVTFCIKNVPEKIPFLFEFSFYSLFRKIQDKFWTLRKNNMKMNMYYLCNYGKITKSNGVCPK